MVQEKADRADEDIGYSEPPLRMDSGSSMKKPAALGVLPQLCQSIIIFMNPGHHLLAGSHEF